MKTCLSIALKTADSTASSDFVRYSIESIRI